MAAAAAALLAAGLGGAGAPFPAALALLLRVGLSSFYSPSVRLVAGRGGLAQSVPAKPR